MKAIFFAAAIFFIFSCTNQVKENQELRNELRSMELELSSMQGTPGYKIGQALEYFYNEDYEEAIKWVDDLENIFPDWNKEVVAFVREKIESKIQKTKS